MKNILITGGSRGIGKATAQKFLDENYKVLVTSTSGDIDYSDENLKNYQLDLSDENSISTLVSDLKRENINIDVLINNAGIVVNRHSPNVSIKSLRENLEVNLIGTVNLTEQLISVINENGVIVNISSGLGSLNEDFGTYWPEYRITKAALNMYTRSLYSRSDLVSNNIKVYSYEPGWVKTDMGGSSAPRTPGQPAQEIFELVNSNNESGLFYNGDGVRSW